MKKAIKILQGEKKKEKRKQTPEIPASAQNDNYDNSQLCFKCSWLLNVDCPGRWNPKADWKKWKAETEWTELCKISAENGGENPSKFEKKRFLFPCWSVKDLHMLKLYLF